jgi:hypothetical protein
MLVKGRELNRHANMMSAPAAAALTELESGQGVALNADGEVILCDGSVRGFVAMSDMNDVKDNVTDKGGMVSFAIGSAVYTVDDGSFDSAETYAFGTRLVYNASGLLTPFDEVTPGDPKAISAVALGPAVDNTLRVAQL